MSPHDIRLEDHVLALLSTQRDALLAGDIEYLTSVSSKLETAISKLRGMSTRPSKALQKIATNAQRNAELIAAAQRGVARARERFSEATAPRLATYGLDGQRVSTGSDTGRILARR